jgi:hypothetical protein
MLENHRRYNKEQVYAMEVDNDTKTAQTSWNELDAKEW